ncbi:hypothetical protein EAG_02132 [Camponotus floridanus]|uniref:Uncharacterized protein n=1 Tax=Camponotus floridanus TaxID=104421 RepID=E2B1R4_CAMFO|nr:hypothetical protein EAG_02132 [Camponotus floridanus]
MALIAVGSRPETPDVTKFFELPVVDRRFEGRVRERGSVCPYYARQRIEQGLKKRPPSGGRDSVFTGPPVGHEVNRQPEILMYLLHPSLPVGFSFGRSCLHLYRITRLSSLESAERRLPKKPRSSGSLVSPGHGTLAHHLRGEPGQDHRANVLRINVMTLRNGDDTIILEVTGSPPVIKMSLMIILGLSLGGCESRAPGPMVRRFHGSGYRLLKKYPCSLVFLRNIRGENELTLGRSEPIRRLVIYERAVKQTPSCLGSLDSPRSDEAEEGKRPRTRGETACNFDLRASKNCLSGEQRPREVPTVDPSECFKSDPTTILEMYIHISENCRIADSKRPPRTEIEAAAADEKGSVRTLAAGNAFRKPARSTAPITSSVSSYLKKMPIASDSKSPLSTWNNRTPTALIPELRPDFPLRRSPLVKSRSLGASRQASVINAPTHAVVFASTLLYTAFFAAFDQLRLVKYENIVLGNAF